MALIDAGKISPPGPIVYYGGLYGKIRTCTKYNTTLVTCDRGSVLNLVCSPAEFEESVRGVFVALFLG